MWIRKRLDIAWSDLAAGMFSCCLVPGRSSLPSRVEQQFSSQAFVCLSVRSGLDLLLGVHHWPKGSEVLVSALTIPDIPRVLLHHGLVPVPVDIEPATLGPNLQSLREAITPSSRAILIAQLMGGRFELEPILQVARDHGLLVIEDCAQAYDGTTYRGHAEADVSTFSFGTIKTATSLGGACLQVRDAALLRAMRARQAGYPVQSRVTFLKRLLKCAVLKGLSLRTMTATLVRIAGIFGVDYDRAINHATRGFAGSDFFERIRQQPSAPLLMLLARRLRRYDRRRVARRARLGQMLAERLPDRCRLGWSMQPHSHWVFPVLVENPPAAIAALRAAGFDATQGHSMCVVSPPTDRPSLVPRIAERILSHVIYLPLYPEMPESALQKLSVTLAQIADAEGTRS